MLTDGAGELLADIMTVSPSLSGIEDSGTSSILDASNYVIQSISFGTAEAAFTQEGYARFLDQNKASQLSGYGGHNLFLAGSSNTITWVNREDATSTNFYYPNDALLPSTPDPSKTGLEDDTNVSANPGSFLSTIPRLDISSLFPGNGQHVNFMPSAIRFGLTEGTALSASLSNFLLGSVMGSFPAGISEQGTLGSYLVYRKPGAAGTLQYFASSVGSYPNEASSMDVSGFITAVSGIDPMSGLTTSSNTDFSSNGIVEYSTTLSKDDLVFLHAYGGIYHLGLWSIDMKQSLLNGNAPPFGFSVLNNPRKYKLFCRKGLSKDLTFTNNLSGYDDLNIKWRLHFL
jgi:hypothetical protein